MSDERKSKIRNVKNRSSSKGTLTKEKKPKAKKEKASWSQEELQERVEVLTEIIEKNKMKEEEEARQPSIIEQFNFVAQISEQEEANEADYPRQAGASRHYYLLPKMRYLPNPLARFTSQSQRSREKLQVKMVRIFSREWRDVIDIMRIVDFCTKRDIEEFLNRSIEILEWRPKWRISDTAELEKVSYWFPDPVLAEEEVKKGYELLFAHVQESIRANNKEGLVPVNVKEIDRKKTNVAIPPVVDFTYEIKTSDGVKQRRFTNILRHWTNFTRDYQDETKPTTNPGSGFIEVVPANMYQWVPQEYILDLAEDYNIIPYRFVDEDIWQKYYTGLQVAENHYQENSEKDPSAIWGEDENELPMHVLHVPASNLPWSKKADKKKWRVVTVVRTQGSSSKFEDKKIYSDEQPAMWYIQRHSIKKKVEVKIEESDYLSKLNLPLHMDEEVMKKISDHTTENLWALRILLNVPPSLFMSNSFDRMVKQGHLVVNFTSEEKQESGKPKYRFGTRAPIKYLRDSIVFWFSPSSNHNSETCMDEFRRKVMAWIDLSLKELDDKYKEAGFELIKHIYLLGSKNPKDTDFCPHYSIPTKRQSFKLSKSAKGPELDQQVDNIISQIFAENYQ